MGSYGCGSEIEKSRREAPIAALRGRPPVRSSGVEMRQRDVKMTRTGEGAWAPVPHDIENYAGRMPALQNATIKSNGHQAGLFARDELMR